MTLHIFNPEHDMALVANSAHWTSPHAGRNLREDLGWIPALWAEDGDIVLVEDVEQAEWFYRRLKLKSKKAHVVFTTLSALSDVLQQSSQPLDAIIPWGWDKSICHQLHNAGVPDGILPTQETLEAIRIASGRQTTLSLMPYLRKGLETATCGEVFSVNNLDEIMEMLHRLGRMVIKSPWSCSGRGVRYLFENDVTDNQINWIRKSLQQQGEMMIEPLYDNLLDFGMEFSISEGSARYIGLSVFDTANRAYTGSLLATEEEKQEQLNDYIPVDLLNTMAQRICQYADDNLASFYSGAFGVDMMIVKGADNKNLLNPCIELNLRRTMGHTALSLSPHERGNKQIMRIAYEGKHYHLRLFENETLLF